MRKPTEIVDFLLSSVGGLERRDLEARLRALREADLYPSGRRVGDRLTEGVNERHCANLLIALLGSNTVTGAVESVSGLANLPLLNKASVENAIVVGVPNNEPPESFVGFLERAIRQWREDVRPWHGDVDIGEIAVWHGEPWRAIVVFNDINPPKDEHLGWMVSYGNADAEQDSRLRMIGHRSIHGHIIGVMAKWLRGDEAGGATA